MSNPKLELYQAFYNHLLERKTSIKEGMTYEALNYIEGNSPESAKISYDQKKKIVEELEKQMKALKDLYNTGKVH